MYNEIKVGESYSIVLKYQPFNTTLMKYGTEYANSAVTGNIAKSLSILWSQPINGVEQYYLAVGCRTERIDIDITENAVMCTQTFIAKTVNTPTTTFVGAGGTGTPTYAAANTGVPWTGQNGGSGPLTINSLSYDVTRFRCSVTQNLDKIRPNGETALKFLEPTNRDVAVDMDIVVKDTTTLADAKTLTGRTASYTMNTGTSSVINLTNLFFNKYSSSDSPTQNKVKMAAFAGVASNVTITG